MLSVPVHFTLAIWLHRAKETFLCEEWIGTFIRRAIRCPTINACSFRISREFFEMAHWVAENCAPQEKCNEKVTRQLEPVKGQCLTTKLFRVQVLRLALEVIRQ